MMKKSFLRLFALVLSLAMMLAFASCGGKETVTTTAAETTTTEGESTTNGESVSEITTIVEGASTTAPSNNPSSGETTTAKPQAGEFALNSSDVAAVVALYKKAIAADANKTFSAKQTLSLKGDITGKGIANIANVAKGPINNMLAKNSTPMDAAPGDYKQLTAADIKSATASTSGTTTTIKLNIKEQQDGVDGKVTAGPVGHAIGVLGGIGEVLKGLEEQGLKADLSKGSVKLTYKDAFVELKINSATGKIESGHWNHQTHVDIKNVKISISFLSVTATELGAVIDYDIKTA